MGEVRNLIETVDCIVYCFSMDYNTLRVSARTKLFSSLPCRLAAGAHCGAVQLGR